MYVISTVNTKRLHKKYILRDAGDEIREFENYQKALDFCKEFTSRNKTYCDEFIYEYKE